MMIIMVMIVIIMMIMVITMIIITTITKFIIIIMITCSSPRSRGVKPAAVIRLATLSLADFVSPAMGTCLLPCKPPLSKLYAESTLKAFTTVADGKREARYSAWLMPSGPLFVVDLFETSTRILPASRWAGRVW